MSLYGVLGPLIRTLPPETAHSLAVKALEHGWVPKPKKQSYPALGQKVWGLQFANPVGLAAGFDKNAQAVVGLFEQGLGFVEVGTVTPKPQPGNPKPRLFRLPKQRAVINRLGFNNQGIQRVRERLIALKKLGGRRPPLGVNVGKNKTSEDAAGDYAQGIRDLGPYADYLTINISSPNTPGLRGLQSASALSPLLSDCVRARDALQHRVPLLVKVAPDLEDDEIKAMSDVIHQSGVDGLIVSNTTVARPQTIPARFQSEAGGLSGEPLFEPSTDVLRKFYRALNDGLPIIGVGGVHDAASAYAKIKAGATCVQVYTAFIYHGFELVREINTGLVKLLAREGYANIAEAVGAEA